MIAPMIAAAGISGLSSLAGGLIGNASARSEARKNRKWQEYMANTAHQREVADLRAAGLNPILSATGGSGAPTGSGAQAQQSDPITPAVSSAMQMFKTSMDAVLTQAQAAKESNSALKLLAEANMIPITSKYTQALTEQASSGASLNWVNQVGQSQKNQIQLMLLEMPDFRKLTQENFKLDNSIKNLDFQSAEQEILRLKNAGEIDRSTFGKYMAYLDKFVSTIGQVLPWFSKRPSPIYQRLYQR